MKKGEMSFALMIVVAAIVIIVVALVMLTIFGGGMQSVGSITSAQSSCSLSYHAACTTTGQPPSDWAISNKVYTDNSGKKLQNSCSFIMKLARSGGDCSCVRLSDTGVYSPDC
jgi:hypothetical protein